VSLITAVGRKLSRLRKLGNQAAKFSAEETNILKSLENSRELGDLLKTAEGNTLNLRKVIESKIGKAFDDGYKGAFERSQGMEYDIDMPRAPMPDNKELVDLSKHEYFRQLDRTLGGETGMQELHDAMPNSFGPRLEEIVNDVSSKIRGNVEDFSMGSSGYKGNGITNKHLSLEERSNEAIKSHMDDINNMVKKESENFIAHSGEYDSWEDFQRLNINKGILSKQNELINIHKAEKARLRNGPRNTRLSQVQQTKPLQDIERRIKLLNKTNIIVLKKDELMRADVLNDIQHSGNALNGTSLGYKVHYLDETGLKFEMELLPHQKGQYEKSIRSSRTGYGNSNQPTGHYIDEGLYVEGVPSDAIKQKWLNAGIKEKDFPMSTERFRDGGVSIGKMNPADLQQKTRAGEDLSVHSMSYSIKPLQKQAGGTKAERLDAYLESQGLPTVDIFNSSYHPLNSKEIFHKAVDKWVTAEQTRESTGIIKTLATMDFGAEYASGNMSPHSLRVLMSEGKRSKQLAQRAVKQLKDTPDKAGGLIGGSRQSLFYQSMNQLEKGREWPAKELYGGKIDVDFNVPHSKGTRMSGTIETFPFQKVTKTGELQRNKAGKTITVDGFYESFHKGGKPSDTMKGILETALSNNKSITIEGLTRDAIAINPKGFTSVASVINSFSRSLSRIGRNQMEVEQVLRKLLPAETSAKDFVGTMGKGLLGLDKKFKDIFGPNAKIFLKADVSYDIDGNLIRGLDLNIYHTGVKLSRSVEAKRIIKSFSAIVVAPFGEKIVVKDRGENK
tara:strand:+ start:2082 stop:4439 length:2358 start_codon:yes stop_codon:yes gene_type:complete